MVLEEACGLMKLILKSSGDFPPLWDNYRCGTQPNEASLPVATQGRENPRMELPEAIARDLQGAFCYLRMRAVTVEGTDSVQVAENEWAEIEGKKSVKGEKKFRLALRTNPAHFDSESKQ